MEYQRIIQIGEHTVELPPLPPKSQILNYGKSDWDSVWTRIEFPKIWYDYNVDTVPYQQDTKWNEDNVLVSLSYEDSELLKKLLKQENHRRKHGVHIKIKDKIVWLAPSYYYTLQWGAMKDLPQKYGNYRSPQNRIMTLWHNVKFNWDWCSGLVLPKTKKSGMSQIFATDFLNDATQYKLWEMGAMSKDFKHCQNVQMGYIFYAYDNLPYIMQATMKKRNLSEIEFGKPREKVGSKRIGKVIQSQNFLNSAIRGYKTKPTGFDGPVMRMGWITELPKTWEASGVSPDVIHKKVRETVRIQQKKNGALIYESYMPEVDDQGYREFRAICKASKLSTRNAISGRTESGMIVYELTAVESNEEGFDRWGDPDIEGNLARINAEYNGLRDASDKQAHRRQYPRNANDMYDSGGRGATFDNLRLALRQRELLAELKSGQRPYLEGHLRWNNSLWESGTEKRPEGQFSTVYLEPLTEEEMGSDVPGSFKMFHSLPEEFLNQVIKQNSRVEDDPKGDFYKPIEHSKYDIVGSCDPTDYALKSDVGEGSMFACHGGFLYDPALDTMFKYPISNSLLYEYHFRHEDPNDDLEMLIKIIIFLGVRVIIEANKKWVVTAVKREGLQYFLLLKQADGSIRPYKRGDENKLFTTTHDVINAYIRALKVFMAMKPGGIDYMRTLKSFKAIQQLMDFDPTQTKIFDLVVSMGLWRLAVESFSVFRTDQGDRDGDYSADTMEYALNQILFM